VRYSRTISQAIHSDSSAMHISGHFHNSTDASFSKKEDVEKDTWDIIA